MGQQHPAIHHDYFARGADAGPGRRSNEGHEYVVGKARPIQRHRFSELIDLFFFFGQAEILRQYCEQSEKHVVYGINLFDAMPS